MEVHYLDNSATTPVLPEAAQAAVELMTEEYGNPSSLHTKGFAARQRVEAARAAVAARLGARPEELTFTSGGTEANNLALFGAAQARKRMGRKIKEIFSELKKVTWPSFGKVVKSTGVVITVVVIFLVVFTAINFGLSSLLELITGIGG